MGEALNLGIITTKVHKCSKGCHIEIERKSIANPSDPSDLDLKQNVKEDLIEVNQVPNSIETNESSRDISDDQRHLSLQQSNTQMKRTNSNDKGTVQLCSNSKIVDSPSLKSAKANVKGVRNKVEIFENAIIKNQKLQ